MTAVLTTLGWLDLAASVVLAGGLVFATLVAPPSPGGRRTLHRAAGMCAVVLPLEFALTAFRMHALSGVSGTTLVLDLLGMHWGRLWILRCLGLAAVVLAPLSPRQRAAVAALWLLPRSFQGHAGAHGTIPAVIDWLHLLAAAVWLGSLVQLAHGPHPIPGPVADRARTLATTSLAILIPAGMYATWLHVPGLAALVETGYGRALVVKLLLVLALVVMGATNHFRHVPALRRGDPAAAEKLGRTIRHEIVAAAAVLLLAALLGVLPMPHGDFP